MTKHIIFEDECIVEEQYLQEYFSFKAPYYHIKRVETCINKEISDNLNSGYGKYKDILFKDLCRISSANHQLTLLMLRLTHDLEFGLKVFMDSIYNYEIMKVPNPTIYTELKSIIDYDAVSNLIKEKMSNGKTLKDIADIKLGKKEYWGFQDFFSNCTIGDWIEVTTYQQNESAEEWQIRVDEIKWYKLLECGTFSNFARFYINAFAKYDIQNIYYCNVKSNESSTFSKDRNKSFLMRIVERRNDVSHQNFILKKERIIDRNLKTEINCYLNDVSNKYPFLFIESDRFLNQSYLSWLFEQNMRDFDNFYITISILNSLSRSEILLSKKVKMCEYISGEITKVVQSLESITSCVLDSYVLNTIKVLKVINNLCVYLMLEQSSDLKGNVN